MHAESHIDFFATARVPTARVLLNDTVTSALTDLKNHTRGQKTTLPPLARPLIQNINFSEKISTG